MTYDYDLFVIGAGSGGVRAARMAARFGAKTAIAESYRVGGTCVIRGCVPKKLFVYASHYAADFQEAAGFGWHIPPPHFDWHTLRANKDKEIDRLNKAYTANLEAAGVEIIPARASVLDAHSVQLDAPLDAPLESTSKSKSANKNKARQITAKYILIATGARPYMPELAGIEHVISSNEAFALESLPRDIVIVGGGYIAVEFACIFHGLGVKTTLAYRGKEILRGFDEDISRHTREEMEKKGVCVLRNQQVQAIEKKAGRFRVQFDNFDNGSSLDGSSLEAGLVMYATGRVPNIEGLGLEAAGVALGAQGAVCVDAFSKTNIDSIYAVGDVTNRAQLTPIAICEGAAFAQTVFNNRPQKIDYRLIPTAVFSQPPIGTIGLTEAAARASYEVDIYRSIFRPLKHTLSGSAEKTMMKLIVDRKTDRVLGLHIVGADAGEMIQAFAVAITMGATKAQFDASLAVHPTAAEELVTMYEKIEG